MFQIKNLSIILILAIMIASCSEYQKVLNKGKVEDQYKLATKLYEEGKYSKSLQLFEKVIPKYRRKPQFERIQFMVAQSNYMTKDYDLAAYYFNRFIGNYPKSSKIEEAVYMVAHSYYLGSPKSSLDQSDTQKALVAFQDYIDKYPDSDKTKEANILYNELTIRLERKAFELAKLYYTTERYNSAIVALDVFLEDNYGTKFKEKALGYKFLSAYELGMQSIITKKKKRLDNAITAYQRFKISFPKSDRLKKFADLKKKLEAELKTTKQQLEKYKIYGS